MANSEEPDQTTPRSLVSLRCPPEETRHPFLSNMRPVRFRSDCAHAQADLNLRCAHMVEGTFSDLMTQIYPSVCMIKKKDFNLIALEIKHLKIKIPTFTTLGLIQRTTI